MKKNKRIVIKSKFRLLSIIFVIALINMGITTYSLNGSSAKDNSLDDATEYLNVYVDTNDTVWSIVNENLDNIELNYRDIRDVVENVIEVNSIENGKIVPGDVVLIPLR